MCAKLQVLPFPKYVEPIRPPKRQKAADPAFYSILNRQKYLEGIKEKSVRVLSSCRGSIGKILLIFFNDDVYRKVFIDLIYKMAREIEQIEFFVLHNSADIGVLKHTLLQIKAELNRYCPDVKLQCSNIEVSTQNDLVNLPTKNWKWVQDKLLVGQTRSSDQIVLLNPMETFDGKGFYDDRSIAKQLKGHFHFLNSPVYFGEENFLNAGGNFLTDRFSKGNRFLLVGGDRIHYERIISNPRNYKKFEREIFRIYSKVFSVSSTNIISLMVSKEKIKRLIAELNKEHNISYKGKLCKLIQKGGFLGKKQPIFHIDMFVTLTGVTIGGKYQVLVGDPQLDPKIDKESRSKINSVFRGIRETLNEIARLFDERFNVLRNPLPFVFNDEKDGREITRNWYFASYNNCIVQSKIGSKYVWLPSFTKDYRDHLSDEIKDHSDDEIADHSRLVHFESENIALWTKLGFKVVLLEDYHGIARERGGPHCLVKCLQRI